MTKCFNKTKIGDTIYIVEEIKNSEPLKCKKEIVTNILYNKTVRYIILENGIVFNAPDGFDMIGDGKNKWFSTCMESIEIAAHKIDNGRIRERKNKINSILDKISEEKLSAEEINKLISNIEKITQEIAKIASSIMNMF